MMVVGQCHGDAEVDWAAGLSVLHAVQADQFREAASRLTFKPSTSPNQPLSLASLIRSLRLAMISMSRGRAVGASRRLGHRKHECSCLQVEP